MKTIEIETTDKGVTIWVKERKTYLGKRYTARHWVVDASDIKNDGVIRIATKQEGWRKSMEVIESSVNNADCYKLKTSKP